MKRHGDEEVGPRENIRAGASHPARHGVGEFGPVGVFEPMNELARRAVLETGDSAGAREHRRISDRLRREQRRAEVLFEGRAEALAKGSLDEAHRAPAF